MTLHLTCLTSLVEGEEWKGRKAIALQMTSLAEFWSSDERFEILGEAEMRDRIERALEAAGSLLDRLTSLERSAPADLARRLAGQLWLIGIAIDDLREKRPSEAILVVDHRDGDGARAFAGKLAAMYESWARARRMRFDTTGCATAAGGRWILFSSGFGAHTLLAAEAGLHVLEIPGRDPGQFDRVTANVRVAAVRPDIQVGRGRSLAELATTLVPDTSESPIVVRRYREHPSPLVRDSVRNWKTGRADLVFDGNFDLIAP